MDEDCIEFMAILVCITSHNGLLIKRDCKRCEPDVGQIEPSMTHNDDYGVGVSSSFGIVLTQECKIYWKEYHWNP